MPFGFPILAAAFLAALTCVASAQDAPGFDPGELPAVAGRVQLFTLTPRGDIDGLILSDGTEVKTPPHLSPRIARIVRPGDAVTIHGLRAAKLPLVLAVSVTNDRDGTSVVDRGPGPPPPAEGSVAVEARVTTGQIRMVLHGVRGEANGVLLQDGTILRLPPPELDRFTRLLTPGSAIAAKGDTRVSPAGTVVEVSALGTSPDKLEPVE